MSELSLQNPVFATYTIAATIMILKAVGMSWLTVVRMMQANGGFRSPEDVRKTPLNPAPSPKQLEPDERVERIRRIHLNDLENVPFFLASGLLFVLTGPSLLLARRLSDGADTRHARRPVDRWLADPHFHDRPDAVRSPRLLKPRTTPRSHPRRSAGCGSRTVSGATPASS